MGGYFWEWLYNSADNIFRTVQWYKDGRIAYISMESERTHWNEKGQKIREIIRDKTTPLFIKTTWHNNG